MENTAYVISCTHSTIKDGKLTNSSHYTYGILSKMEVAKECVKRIKQNNIDLNGYELIPDSGDGLLFKESDGVRDELAIAIIAYHVSDSVEDFFKFG